MKTIVIQIRFSLDENLDANLIAEIKEKANSGSLNDAARFLLRFYHEQERRQNLSLTGQHSVIERTDNDNDNGSQEINLSGLDSIFSSESGE